MFVVLTVSNQLVRVTLIIIVVTAISLSTKLKQWNFLRHTFAFVLLFS